MDFAGAIFLINREDRFANLWCVQLEGSREPLALRDSCVIA